MEDFQITDNEWDKLEQSDDVLSFIQRSNPAISSLDVQSQGDELTSQRLIARDALVYPSMEDISLMSHNREYEVSKCDGSEATGSAQAKLTSKQKDPFICDLPDFKDLDEVDRVLWDYDTASERGKNVIFDESWFSSISQATYTSAGPWAPGFGSTNSIHNNAKEIPNLLVSQNTLPHNNQPEFVEYDTPDAQGFSLSNTTVNWSVQPIFGEKIDRKRSFRKGTSAGALVHGKDIACSFSQVLPWELSTVASDNLDGNTFDQKRLDQDRIFVPVTSSDMTSSSVQEEMQSAYNLDPDMLAQSTPNIICRSSNVLLSHVGMPCCHRIHEKFSLEKSDYPIRRPDMIFQEMTEILCFDPFLNSPSKSSDKLMIGPASSTKRRKKVHSDLGDEVQQTFRGSFFPQLGSSSSSFTEESCAVSSSTEASVKGDSFKELHEVVNQLDYNTKLCFRDGLYRLARSFRERHAFANQMHSTRKFKTQLHMAENLGGLGFTSEMQTKLLDCSISHLLFHRPSDPFAGLTAYGVPVRTYLANE